MHFGSAASGGNYSAFMATAPLIYSRISKFGTPINLLIMDDNGNRKLRGNSKLPYII